MNTDPASHSAHYTNVGQDIRRPAAARRLVSPALSVALAWALSAPAILAHAQIPGFGQPAPCPPNMSCVPGTPPSTPLPTPGPTPGTCGPGAGGAPCSAGAGNPINTMTGNKFQREVDMAPLPGVLGLEIVRYYNSAFSRPGSSTNLVGRGWKLSYEVELVASASAIQIVQADGTRSIFSRDPRNPSLCASADPSQGAVRVARGASGDEYIWQQTDGTQLSFNGKGKLVQIIAPSGEFTTLQHDRAGLLLAVTDPQGRQLRLSYPDRAARRADGGFGGVQAIDSPLGRYTYAHGAPLPKGADADKALLLASLVSVRYPDGQQGRDYHYEDARFPTLLTGISIREGKQATRLSTYGYGPDARAILSMRAGGVDKVSLDFSQGGQTTVTNSLGQKTVYRYAVLAGEYRLMEVRGAGCAECSEPNVRYGYDQYGRMNETVKLDDQGRPLRALRTEFDNRSRPLALREIVYRQGKPGAPRLLARYEYAQFDQPTLIARPSVVEGREVLTRISYNPHGQPLVVSEHGWAPAPDGKGIPQQISRTLRQAYRVVNGRSLLVSIDGPLANGKAGTPLDSDITQLQWDERGNAIVAVTAPGGEVNKVSYDKAGRIADVEGGAGASAFGYDARGRVSEVRADGVVRRTRYDALGNLVENGIEGGGRYTALARHGYDDAGRRLWSVSHLGVLERRLLDSEGRVLAHSTHSGPFGTVQRYEYDAQGRVTASIDSNGAARRIRYDALGRPELVIDPLGRATRYAWDEEGRVSSIAPASNSAFARLMPTAIGFEYDAHGNTAAVRAPTGGATRTVFDDFGRALAVASPDSGVRIQQFDAAGRLVAGRDALGNTASYHYDVAGRIVRQEVRHAASGKTVNTRWTWQGRHLAAIEHPEQRESYRHDARGRVIARTVGLALGDGRHVYSTTRYRYDEQGRLAASTLADGSLLEYQRDAQGRIVALQRHRIHTPWLRWLLPSQTVVKDVTASIAGMTGYTYGNGVQARLVRGPNGTLAQVLHRRAGAGVVKAEGKAAVAGLWVDRSLDLLLGMRHAHAAAPIAGPAAKRNELSLLGALGTPADSDALLDYRYLWDVQGNLLHLRGRGTASDYGYDAQDRLILASGGTQGVATLEVAQQSRSARYFYDGAGNRVLAQEDASSAEGGTVRVNYTGGGNRAQAAQGTAVQYDAAGQPLGMDGREYGWDAHGRLLAVKQNGAMLASYRYNHRGERIAKAAGKSRRHFLYQERRIAAELDAEGRLLRQYVYLADKPVQVIDTAGGRDLANEERSGFKQGLADLGTALSHLFGADERLAYLHHNHLGAPELVTDDAGKPVWRAGYAPFGQLIPAAGPATAIEMNLRLPGQYEDAETGLYYNDHRYYDPQRGRYLTPDPLGLRAGINTYAYVAGNPLKYVDPNGLVLFAFDGTGNSMNTSDPAMSGNGLTNVVHFFNAYKGNREYVSGVGTVHSKPGDTLGEIKPDTYANGTLLDWLTGSDPLYVNDMGGNYSGPARIERMIQYMNQQADAAADGEAMDIDIVGFSRGAAQGRHFANLIAAATNSQGIYTYKDPKTGEQRCQKVNFRFMGLFDTVESTNRSSVPDYSLTIPDVFKHVAHAVALNEYRDGSLLIPQYRNPKKYSGHFGGFPLESIGKTVNEGGKVRIEKGFLGAHADIGGGYPDGENQLSLIALNWMVRQAQDAGLDMGSVAAMPTSNPVLHDPSMNIVYGNPLKWQNADYGPPSPYPDVDPGIPRFPEPEDREVHGGLPGGDTQRTMKFDNGSMVNGDTHQFINYHPRKMTQLGTGGPEDARTMTNTGTVEVAKYLEWLRKNGYCFAGDTGGACAPKAPGAK